jgi:hypothetical protein
MYFCLYLWPEDELNRRQTKQHKKELFNPTPSVKNISKNLVLPRYIDYTINLESKFLLIFYYGVVRVSGNRKVARIS